MSNHENSQKEDPKPQQRNAIWNLISETPNSQEITPQQNSTIPKTSVQPNKSPQVRIIAQRSFSQTVSQSQHAANLKTFFQNQFQQLQQTPQQPQNDEEEIVISAKRPTPQKQTFVIPKILLPQTRPQQPQPQNYQKPLSFQQPQVQTYQQTTTPLSIQVQPQIQQNSIPAPINLYQQSQPQVTVTYPTNQKIQQQIQMPAYQIQIQQANYKQASEPQKHSNTRKVATFIQNPKFIPQDQQKANQSVTQIQQIPVYQSQPQNQRLSYQDPQTITLNTFGRTQSQQIQQILPYYIQQNQQKPVPSFTISISQQPKEPPKPRIPIPSPVISLTNTNRVLIPPSPVYCNDPQIGTYGIRCVCGKGKEECLKVYCELCGFYLHAHCVNVARVSEYSSYYCPFCRGQKIRCKCGENSNYSIPIIQCSVCKLWVHKECEDIDYGLIPQHYICSFCFQEQQKQKQKDEEESLKPQTKQTKEKETKKFYPIPYYFLKSSDLNMREGIDINDSRLDDRMEVLSKMPDGLFKTMLLEDFKHSSLSFCAMISKYFQTFVTYFFERSHEFWKTFVETFSNLFDVEKSFVLRAVDFLAYKLLYDTTSSATVQIMSTASSKMNSIESLTAIHGYHYVENLENSESIEQYLSTLSCPKLSEMPKSVILTHLRDGRIITSQPIDDGQFIIELPGFLMHSDEIDCDKGIPPFCLTVTNKDLVIDISVSRMAYLCNIKRSFHFNCIVKLIRVGGELRCALYGTKPTGPLYDDKGKRGPAILPDHELFLPLDGFLPFPVQKHDWKEKKTKSKTVSAQISQRMSRSHSSEQISRERNILQKPKKEDKKPFQPKESPVKLSLLSGFTYDIIPPLPFILVNEHDKGKETHEKKKQERRTIHQRKRSRGWSD